MHEASFVRTLSPWSGPVATFVLALVAACGASADPASASRAALPITAGADDPADPHVVAVVASKSFVCTGTLVHPRVVVTAAHCLLARPDAVEIPEAAAVPVVASWVHPDFDGDTLNADVAVLALGRPVLGVAPAELLRARVPAGASVRLVGYGADGHDPARPPRKRSGTARVGEVSVRTFRLEPGPSLPCAGDSGGPSFLVHEGRERLAGVTSSGDDECLTGAVASRVDVVAPFVDDAVAALNEGRPWPSRGGAGTACERDDACASALCAAPSGPPGVCADPCKEDTETCGAGLTCAPSGRTSAWYACLATPPAALPPAAAPPPGPTGETSSACAVAERGGPTSAGGLCGLLASLGGAWLARRRRDRRRARCAGWRPANDPFAGDARVGRRPRGKRWHRHAARWVHPGSTMQLHHVRVPAAGRVSPEPSPWSRVAGGAS